MPVEEKAEEKKEEIKAPEVFKARREIPVFDQSGNKVGSPHVYEGEAATQAEADQIVADKMASAISNGTLKIRELSLKAKNGGLEAPPIPEGAEVDDYEVPEPKIQDLSADELFKINEKLKNPETMRAGFRELYKAETGREPIDDAKTRQEQANHSRILAAKAESENFVASHPEYFACAPNQKAMADYIVSRKLKWTQKNLEKGFEELTADGLLVSAPEEKKVEVKPVVKEEEKPEPPVVEQPRTEAVEVKREIDRIPSAIRPSQASGADTKPKSKEPSAKELAMMNADQYQAYAESRGLWPKR